MNRQRVMIDDRRSSDHARRRLLATVPLKERRLQLAGVSTAVLEGGVGPSVVLLHEQSEFAASWMRVIPGLMTTHHVVAPDLPGHGASDAGDGPLDADRVFAWLGELIEQLCPSPPTLVGHMLGGAIAARFAARHCDRIARLVLVDTFGLAWFRPSPKVALSLIRYIIRPSQRTHDGLHRHCTVNLDQIRDEMGEGWEAFQGYSLDRVRDPGVKAALGALMRQLGVPAIPSADLERISVPTTLIWGRHDPVTRLRTAQSASARYGWPLHVIENAGDVPALERPEEFLRALRTATANSR